MKAYLSICDFEADVSLLLEILPISTRREHRVGQIKQRFSKTEGGSYLSNGCFEGWIESLALEVADFGIRSMLVEPGFFRTDLLSAGSTTYAPASIDDYAVRRRETVTAWMGTDGKQGGDPAKLAQALIRLANLDEPPTRFAAGTDAVHAFESKAGMLLAQADLHRGLSSTLGVTEPA